MAQYRCLLPLVRPELILLAEREGKAVGFLFAAPDLLQAQRGAPIDTLILKTVAVLPGRAYAGLGILLAERCHAKARDLGYRRVVHALMHDANRSRNVSAHYATPIRGYTLFSRQLS